MMNDETIDLFCQEIYSGAKASTVYQIKITLRHVKDFEDKLGKGVQEFTLEEFQELFEINKWTIARSELTRCKSLIMAYMRWLQQKNGEVYHYELRKLTSGDLDQSVNYGQNYFASEDDFASALFTTLGGKEQIRERTICILYWIGMTREEVINLKVSELKSEFCTVSEYPISERLYGLVDECARLKEWDIYLEDALGRKMCRHYLLPDSEYLLRKSFLVKESSSTDDLLTGEDTKISAATVNKFFRTINHSFEKLPKDNRYCNMKLRRSVLSNSGMFVKLYSLEQQGVKITSVGINGVQDDSVIEVLKRYHVSLSESNVFNTMQKYFGWKKYFFC